MLVTAGLTSLLGIGVLTLGAELLVRGATRLAVAVGISPLVVGLTVVAFGTSAPELVVSIRSTLSGQPDVAIGNVIGSNLFNLMGVLGVSSLVSPDGTAVSQVAFRHDIPVMIAVAIICLPVFATGQRVNRWEGGLFLAGYAAYITFIIIAAS